MRVCQQERRRPARAGPRGRQAVRLLDAPHALPCNKRSRRSAAGGGGVITLAVSATKSFLLFFQPWRVGRGVGRGHGFAVRRSASQRMSARPGPSRFRGRTSLASPKFASRRAPPPESTWRCLPGGSASWAHMGSTCCCKESTTSTSEVGLQGPDRKSTSRC